MVGRRRSIFAAAGTFVLGFGVMNAFWFLAKHPQELPGHWDYRAPIIGDGLLLPVAAGILVAALDSLPTAPHERRMALGSALFGGVVGAYSQWAWLRDPAPSPVWILPEPHHFTLAGWYHAAFLVAASAWFSGAGVIVLWRLRSLRQTKSQLALEAVLRNPWTAILFACLFGFAALGVLDSTPSAKTVASQGSIVALILGILVSLGLMRWVLGPMSWQAWKGVASGGLFALGLAWLTADWGTALEVGAGDVLAVGLITLALAIELIAWGSRDWLLLAAIAAVWLLAGLNRAAQTPASEWTELGELWLPIVIAYAAVVILLLRLVDAPRGVTERRILVCVLPVPLVLTTIAAWLERHPEAPLQESYVELAFTMFVLSWLVTLGKSRYSIAINIQSTLDRGLLLESGFISVWVTITSILAVTAAGFLRAIDASGATLGWDSSHLTRSPYPAHIVWAGAVALLFGMVAAVIAKPQASGPESYVLQLGENKRHTASKLSIPLVPWALVMVSTLAWLCMPAMVWLTTGRVSWNELTIDLNTFGWIVIVLSTFITLWLIATSFLNLWGTVAQIQFFRLGKKEMALVWLASISFGTNAFWLLIIGFWSDHRLVRFIDIASLTGLVVLCGVFVAVGVTLVIARSTPLIGVKPRYLTLFHPATTLGQDHLIHGFMLVLAVIMLVLAYRLSELGFGGWAAAVFAAFPLVAGFGEQTIFSTEAYNQHIRSERLINIEQTRRSLLARVQWNSDRAYLLNNERCDAIQWRANWVNTLASWLALPLLAMQLVSRMWRAIVRWATEGPGTSPDLEEPNITAVVNETQELFVPDQVLAYLGINRGDPVAFTIDEGTVRIQPVRSSNSVPAETPTGDVATLLQGPGPAP